MGHAIGVPLGARQPRIMPRIAREGARLRVYHQAPRTWTRAAIPRARRCRIQGETIKAGDLRAPMCHRDTDEFDTVDLGEALAVHDG